MVGHTTGRGRAHRGAGPRGTRTRAAEDRKEWDEALGGLTLDKIETAFAAAEIGGASVGAVAATLPMLGVDATEYPTSGQDKPLKKKEECPAPEHPFSGQDNSTQGAAGGESVQEAGSTAPPEAPGPGTRA